MLNFFFNINHIEMTIKMAGKMNFVKCRTMSLVKRNAEIITE